MHVMGKDSEDHYNSKQSLTVIDNRTGKSFQIPIEDGHFINATSFRRIEGIEAHDSPDTTLDEEGDGSGGLCLYDPASPEHCRSSFQDKLCGWRTRLSLLYRGSRIEDMVEHSNFLEVAYLLIYGELPDRIQAAEWQKQIMTILICMCA